VGVGRGVVGIEHALEDLPCGLWGKHVGCNYFCVRRSEWEGPMGIGELADDKVRGGQCINVFSAWSVLLCHVSPLALVSHIAFLIVGVKLGLSFPL